tara:strand:+ start:381 stop:542 length:162 start_codon:yes stop_codon:yes gene_type:complete
MWGGDAGFFLQQVVELGAGLRLDADHVAGDEEEQVVAVVQGQATEGDGLANAV